MADYIGIKGSNVPAVASDPSNPILGQVWYNTTSNTVKGYATSAPAGAWSSGGTITTGRSNFSSCGTQGAAVIYLGEGPYADKNKTEEYDGTSWTETNPCIVPRQACANGIGIQTAAMAVSGTDGTVRPYVEHYDGNSWSEGADIQTLRYSEMGAGTTTAAIIAGGINPPPANSDCELWNGTAWSETTNINTARHNGQGAGTSTATVIAGGTAPGAGPMGNCEIWDGSTWTTVNALVQARTNAGGATNANSTDFMIFGGTPSVQSLTEVWNGTCWTEVADMATARIQCEGAGTTGAALVTGGNPGYLTSTEEWDAGSAVQTFTSS